MARNSSERKPAVIVTAERAAVVIVVWELWCGLIDAMGVLLVKETFAKKNVLTFGPEVLIHVFRCIY